MSLENAPALLFFLLLSGVLVYVMLSAVSAVLRALARIVLVLVAVVAVVLFLTQCGLVWYPGPVVFWGCQGQGSLRIWPLPLIGR
jgi:hypothetical protein